MSLRRKSKENLTLPDDVKVRIVEKVRVGGVGDDFRNAVQKIDSEVWKTISAWAKKNERLEGWQRSIAWKVGDLLENNDLPSPKQAKQAVRLLFESVDEGFEHDKLTEELLRQLRTFRIE